MIFGITKNKVYVDKYKSDCGCCKLNQQFDCLITSNYFHVLFIPTFPLGIETFLQCNFCKTIYTEKEIDYSLRKKMSEKIQIKTPIWQWIGSIMTLFIIAVLMFFAK